MICVKLGEKGQGRRYSMQGASPSALGELFV